MFEYGLSVSLNTTPRTGTSTPIDNSYGNGNGNGFGVDFDTLCWAPRKRTVVVQSGENVEEEESISPRVLFREEEIPPIARRLDFEDDPVVSFELSSPSPSPSTAPSSFRTVVADKIETIGSCGVCYSQLPLRANHIFTVCGHLFCVRCLLKWWDTNTTCPLCRAEIFVDDDVPISDNQVVEEEEEEVSAAVDNDNDRTTDDESGDDDGDNDDDDPRQNQQITRINQYLYQDAEWNWSLYSPLSDDMLIEHLTPGEIYGIRENREIATNLFARSRFRYTLLQSNSLFMGRVWNGMFIHKNHWINIMSNEQFQEQRNSSPPTMFEFVIRRESEISPVYEINIFGFMKDVIIIAVDRVDGGMYNDDDWENRCEYAFVAEVFTPTDFYIGGDGGGGGASNMVQSYGSYDITEGIINTERLVIPFLQIRRLYRLTSHEQVYI